MPRRGDRPLGFPPDPAIHRQSPGGAAERIAEGVSPRNPRPPPPLSLPTSPKPQRGDRTLHTHRPTRTTAFEFYGLEFASYLEPNTSNLKGNLRNLRIKKSVKSVKSVVAIPAHKFHIARNPFALSCYRPFFEKILSPCLTTTCSLLAAQKSRFFARNTQVRAWVEGPLI
jgi:hypothetical protein